MIEQQHGGAGQVFRQRPVQFAAGVQLVARSSESALSVGFEAIPVINEGRHQRRAQHDVDQRIQAFRRRDVKQDVHHERAAGDVRQRDYHRRPQREGDAADQHAQYQIAHQIEVLRRGDDYHAEDRQRRDHQRQRGGDQVARGAAERIGDQEHDEAQRDDDRRSCIGAAGIRLGGTDNDQQRDRRQRDQDQQQRGEKLRLTTTFRVVNSPRGSGEKSPKTAEPGRNARPRGRLEGNCGVDRVGSTIHEVVF